MPPQNLNKDTKFTLTFQPILNFFLSLVFHTQKGAVFYCHLLPETGLNAIRRIVQNSTIGLLRKESIMRGVENNCRREIANLRIIYYLCVNYARSDAHTI